MAPSPNQTQRTAVAETQGLPFSPAVAWGDLVFTSGQIASSEPPGDFASQAREALGALQAVLAQADCTLTDVLRVDAFLADAAHFAASNEVFRETFPAAPPARTTVTAGFVIEGALIEVQAVAGRRAS